MNILDKFREWKVDNFIKFLIIWAVFSVIIMVVSVWRVHVHREYCADKVASMECSNLNGMR